MRIIRLGLLGLGGVGASVARLCHDARPVHRALGFVLEPVHALVRDASRARERLPSMPAVSADPEAFLADAYDVVIEALGGVEPAGALARRLLDRGTPVVTANKSMVAAYGRSLRALAHERHVAFLYDASALAGVPYVGSLLRRPLFGSASRVVGILNGTSNYILTSMARDGASFDAALAAAQDRGYAEPVPDKDLGGVDAAEKLIVLLSTMGVDGVRAEEVACLDLRRVHPLDLAGARELGGTLRPVVTAHLSGSAGRLRSGPAFVPAGHWLAGVEGTENAVELAGPFLPPIAFRGTGAGPDVTAATLLDDAVEAAAGVPTPAPPEARAWTTAEDREPHSWFVRLLRADDPVDRSAAAEALASHSVFVEQSVEVASDRWRAWCLLTLPCSPRQLEPALAAAESVARARSLALPTL